MAQFKYTAAQPCHVTLNVNDEYKEFSFFRDEIYDLPEENSIVKRMQAQGLLEAANTTNAQFKIKKSNGS